MRPTTQPYYSVRPRYTPGSPGTVSKEVALRVAAQEVAAMNSCLMGLYGRSKAIEAVRLGLHGIVEKKIERKGGWDIVDVITGQKRRQETIRAKDLRVGDFIYSTSTGRSVYQTVAAIQKDAKTVYPETEKSKWIFPAKAKVTIVRVVQEAS